MSATVYFAQLRQREVIGVDLSAALIEVARQRSVSSLCTFRVDDAQRLDTVADATMAKVCRRKCRAVRW